MLLNIDAKNSKTMKLLHFFITQKDYTPILIKGLKDEIWLENFGEDYRIIRIVNKRFINTNQLSNDLTRTKRVVRKIKSKTFSFSMKTLTIYMDVDEDVKRINDDKFFNIYLHDLTDLEDVFPSIVVDELYEKKGAELFVNISRDIAVKNDEKLRKSKKIFSNKKPQITYVILAINLLMFLLLTFSEGGSTYVPNLIQYGAQYNPLIIGGEYWRLISSAFLHIGVVHFLLNNYAIYVLAPNIENYFGPKKFTFIYLFSAFFGSIVSMLFVDAVSAGASGALFGLLGAYLYFAYRNRPVIRELFKNNIVMLIALNLFLGFSIEGINNAAHIGGLIGGIFAAMSVGIRFENNFLKRINLIIPTIILTVALTYLAFFEKEITPNQALDSYMYNYYRENVSLEKAEDFLIKTSKNYK